MCKTNAFFTRFQSSVLHASFFRKFFHAFYKKKCLQAMYYTIKLGVSITCLQLCFSLQNSSVGNGDHVLLKVKHSKDQQRDTTAHQKFRTCLVLKPNPCPSLLACASSHCRIAYSNVAGGCDLSLLIPKRNVTCIFSIIQDLALHVVSLLNAGFLANCSDHVLTSQSVLLSRTKMQQYPQLCAGKYMDKTST